MYTTISYGSVSSKIKDDSVAVEILRLKYELWNKLVSSDYYFRGEIDRRIQSELGLNPSINRVDLFKREDVHDIASYINDVRRESANAHCRDSGLWWANYSDVRKEYEKARKQKGNLQHKNFDGTGRLTVHYPHGIYSHEVFLEDRHFRIDGRSMPTKNVARNIRRKHAQTNARIRIGSIDKRKPLWFELPIMMHRPLPDGKIRDVHFVRERIGRDFRWKIVIILEIKDIIKPAGSGVVAIDVGWRVTENGLRVAYWTDDRQNSGELLLPNKLVSGMRKVRDIRAIRSSSDPVKYNHLYDYEYHMRDQLQTWRREIYRIFSSHICKEYSTILIHDLKLGHIELGNNPSYNRRLAAIHILYQTIENAAQKNGVIVRRISKPSPSRPCYKCGFIDIKDDGKLLMRKCPACDTVYDRDYGTAQNLLRLAGV